MAHFMYSMEGDDSESLVFIEEDHGVILSSGMVDALLNLSNQLAATVAELGQRVPSSMGAWGILHTQPVQSIPSQNFQAGVRSLISWWNG